MTWPILYWSLKRLLARWSYKIKRIHLLHIIAKITNLKTKNIRGVAQTHVNKKMSVFLIFSPFGTWLTANGANMKWARISSWLITQVGGDWRQQSRRLENAVAASWWTTAIVFGAFGQRLRKTFPSRKFVKCLNLELHFVIWREISNINQRISLSFGDWRIM